MHSEKEGERPAFRVPVGTAANPILEPSALQRLMALGRSETVASGEYLFRAGDGVLDFLLIEEGVVDIVQEETADSPRRVISRWRDGEFLGELNMLTGQRALLSAHAIRPSRVRRIPHDAFRTLMSTDGALIDTLVSAFRARRRLLQSTADMTLQIVGTEESAESMALRRFAARMELPHRWLDAATPAGRSAREVCGVAEDELPVVISRTGVHRRATPADLADALGLTYDGGAGSQEFDLVVVGAGPAGIAASIYGASEGLSTLLLDAVAPGGQAASSSRIENYLGFPDGLPGAELTELATLQALKFGVRISAPSRVVSLTAQANSVRLDLSTGAIVTARSVIVASGAQYRRLPLQRWNEFEGGSIFFAATELEARSCSRRPVAVVGGANSAGQAALFLAERASRVTLILRGPAIEAEMSSYLADRVLAHPRIEVFTRTEVTALHGRTHLENITVTSPSGGTQEIEATGLFCFIGAQPDAKWLVDAERDEGGFLLTDVDLMSEQSSTVWQRLGRRPFPFETSIPCVFAAGDVRHGSMKRVAAAVGEGSSAVASAHRALAPR